MLQRLIQALCKFDEITAQKAGILNLKILKIAYKSTSYKIYSKILL
jgi:hypothetical protein